MAATTSDGGIQVIARAAQILRALDGEPDGLSLSQISERLGLPRSTVHRVVGALAAEGFVAAASPGGGVRLGPELARLAVAGRPDLQIELRPHMERVYAALDETVDLAVLEGDHLRFIDQIAAPHPLRAVSAVGGTFPLHCTANGLAVLAAVPPEAISRLLPTRLRRFTPSTVTNRRDLLREIERVREQGVAITREQHTIGISAAAFAVDDGAGRTVTLSVPVPTQRFDGREDEIVAVLRSARDDVATALGLDARPAA